MTFRKIKHLQKKDYNLISNNLKGNSIMDFFKLFHSNSEILIDRSVNLDKICIYLKKEDSGFFAFHNPRKELIKKHYMPGLILLKENSGWQIKIKNNFHASLNKIAGENVNIDNFISFVKDNLTSPEKNPVKVPRFANKEIEALLDFIKLHKHESDILLNEVHFFDTREKNEYQNSVMNNVMREFFEISLYNYSIDERLVSEREIRQTKIWMLFDSSHIEGFHVMATLDNEKPIIFILTSDGDFLETDNILGLVYDIAYYEMDYFVDSAFSVNKFEEYKHALSLYDDFMKKRGLNPDPNSYYHNQEGSLILLDNEDDFDNRNRLLRENNECYHFILNKLAHLYSTDKNDGFEDEEEKIIEDFFPMDC